MEYTVGLRIKDTPCFEHATVAYTAANKHAFRVDGSTLFIDDIAVEHPIPAEATMRIVGEDMLGPEKDVPVWDVAPCGDHGDALHKFIVAVFARVNVEQAHTKGLTEPHLHVTKKRDSPARQTGDVLAFACLFVKPIGKHDAYFELNLGK